MRERECQAPVHADGCPCQTCKRTTCDGCNATNVDHFTPKCIAKVWGWNRKQTDAPENLQWLSRPCHTEKDRTTPKRKQLACKIVSGKTVTLDEYLSAINGR